MGRAIPGRAGEPRCGVVQVARDDARAEAQDPRRLDHQKRQVAAGRARTVERFERGLRALRLAALVDHMPGDAFVEVAQKRQRIGRAAAHEARDPGAEAAIGVVVLAPGQRAEVGPVLVRVGEGIGDRPRGDLEDRPLRRALLERGAAFDDQMVGGGVEGQRRHRIARDILRPGQPRLGVHRDGVGQQAKLVGLARAQDQPVRKQRHRLAVAVGGAVQDVQACHATSVASRRAPRQPQAAGLQRTPGRSGAMGGCAVRRCGLRWRR
jgi:hypothetical protein